MKAKALEIRWHDTQPIFSADFHAVFPEQHRKPIHPYARQAAGPGTTAGVAVGAADGEGSGSGEGASEVPEEEKMWRLATAGGDKNVRLWLVHPRPKPPPPSLNTASLNVQIGPSKTQSTTFDGGPKVEYLATLKQHTGVVNVVRWSPVGETLASAGDDGNILFWVPGESSNQFGESAEDKAYEKESWRVKSMLRTKSGQEIYDLAWSPDGAFILAGSVDHTANIYDVTNGQLVHTIAEHTNYVQGVAWDPHNHFIATQSSDRSMHVYSIAPSGNGGVEVHGVGSGNVRMDVLHQPGGTWRLPTPTEERYKEVGKGKEVEIKFPALPTTFHRSHSQRSDSGSEASSTPASSARFSAFADPIASPSTTHALDEPTSMDPPAAPRPSSSRRSSTSGSVRESPALAPQGLSSSRPLRSPSPAPLPATRPPPSPKLSPALVADTGNPKTDTIKLYGDANSTPFFRRLAWSTDGSLLLTPAGLFEDPYGPMSKFVAEPEGSGKKKVGTAPPVRKGTTSGDATPKPTVYIYSRSNVSRPPIAHLPGHKTTSIAIRFCPVLWELRPLHLDKVDEVEAESDADIKEDETPNVLLGSETTETRLPGSMPVGEQSRSAEGSENTIQPKSLFDLPYRMVYAVATLDSVILYDTQQAGPICMFSNLHYAPFTDLSWSSDGQTLVVSSQDGYCSVVAFDPLELGTPYTLESGLPLPPPPPPLTVPATGSASTISSLFASASSPKITPASLPPINTSASVPISSTVLEPPPLLIPAKRTDDSDDTDVGPDGQPVKKKKRAQLIHQGPIGGAPPPA
ncbi:WD40 repeat-like protein [Meredithblackwellia eburnea MCA 4105]